jgi:hypothetical protein
MFRVFSVKKGEQFLLPLFFFGVPKGISFDYAQDKFTPVADVKVPSGLFFTDSS